jgi:NitT/TauT family transport system substrate-binding protein
MHGMRGWVKNAWCMAGVFVSLLLIPRLGLSLDVKVGTWKTAQTIQPFFYQDFIPSSYRVAVYSFTNPADQRVALLAGSLDMCGTTLAHAIHAASRGEPVVVVAALCNKSSALVVKKGVAVKSVSDLLGKKIGYVPGTMHEILLREALTRHGLNPEKDVHLTRVDFYDMGLALARGGIDAFLSGEPFPSLAVQQGYGEILSYPYYGESVGTINAGMLVHRDTIEKNPGLVQQLVRTHQQATEYLTTHQGAWLEKAATFGTSLVVLQQAVSNMELAWRMDEAFVCRAKELGKRMQVLGVIDRQPDFERLFDLSFVQKVEAGLKQGL